MYIVILIGHASCWISCDVYHSRASKNGTINSAGSVLFYSINFSYCFAHMPSDIVLYIVLVQLWFDIYALVKKALGDFLHHACEKILMLVLSYKATFIDYSSHFLSAFICFFIDFIWYVGTVTQHLSVCINVPIPGFLVFVMLYFCCCNWWKLSLL